MLVVSRGGAQDRHRPPAQRERGLLLRRARRCSRSPTGWAAPRPARSPRGSPRGAFERAMDAEEAAPRRQLEERPPRRNREIHDLAQQDSSRAGMGTTLTAALVDGRRGRVRPRRRQPRLRPPRRRAEAADQGPLAGRGAAPPGPAHRGGGRGAPAALDHHPRARPRARGERRHDDLPGEGGRRLPALQRRADDDGQRRRDRDDPRRGEEPRSGRRQAGRRGERAAAAATTSPRSPSGSPRRAPRSPTRARP